MWNDVIKNTEAFLFDLDGTLIDSMWVWKQIDIDYFESKDMEFPEDYQDLIEGMSVYETAVFTKETYNIEDSLEEMMRVWNEMAFDHYSNTIKLKESAEDFIKYLHESGKKLGIVTSNSKALCHEVLSQNNLIDYFDVIITGESDFPGKPSPDGYLLAAERLNVNPENCIVYEDLCNGIKAGLAANMTTVAVKDAYSDKTWEEKVELADHHIIDYKEIMDAIR